MVGNLASTDRMFRANGYTGLESHFGLGGPHDSGLDGAVWQWQSLGYSADAQAAGNGYGTSVETADGGNPDNPWSSAQLDALVELGTWWARQVGAPGRMVTSMGGSGFGYHRQFHDWNLHGHTCPGDVRLRQYTRLVLPRIALKMAGGPKHAAAPGEKPTTSVTERPSLARTLCVVTHGADVRLVQHLVGALLDDHYGPRTAAAVTRWQHTKNLTPDGVFGPASCRAAGWTWKG
jgi:peptidoglycan hydrolase-like protein with peptidoglycan-binding domain